MRTRCGWQLPLMLAALWLHQESLNAVETDLPHCIAGTWVLQQTDSLEGLEIELSRSLSAALKTPHIRGFCLRVPWRAADRDLSLFEAGYRIARDHGVDYSIRFMAGRHTPQRLFDQGCRFYVVDWGAPTPQIEAAFDRVWEKPICRGQQAIQPRDYPWSALFRKLRENRATYCEVYAPSFTMPRRAELADEIRKFDEYIRAHGPLLPEPAPGR